MKEYLKKIARFFLRQRLRKKGILIDSGVAFNASTVFGGHNVVHTGSKVSDSEIGAYTFIGVNCSLNNVIIGKFCSLGANIKVIAATHPTRDFVSTSPVFYSTFGQCGTTFVNEQKFIEHLTVDSKRDIIIGNDVWIGDNVSIIGGVRIGDGAIIATGAVVTKDVPSYAIVGGVPAHIIRYRFTEDQIKILLEEKWWNKPTSWLVEKSAMFENVEQYINSIE